MILWSIYLLVNNKHTYIGATVNPIRRLRQHNRELTGGARATHWGAPNWTMVLHVDGFKTKSEALRWERIAKCRARGMTARIEAMVQISKGLCPMPYKRSVHYPVPEGLVLNIRNPEDQT